ncbi:MAG TPA: VOC family protein [Pseudomonadales bacterium]|nr:VOC family protein [Pseudomonadales bacterium]
MTTGLIVNIDVPDLDAGRAFYETALGMTFVRTLFGGAIAELRHGGVLVHLHRHAAGSATKVADGAPRSYAPHWTPVHLDLLVDDLERVQEAAVAAGARVERQAQSFSWGRIVRLRDPFGHGLCLIRQSPRGYDTVTP